MRLEKVMDEIAAVLKAGLPELTNAYPYPPGSLTSPAAYVSYPTSIDVDQAYQRGLDQYTDLHLCLVAGKVTARATRDRVAPWVAGAGARSVLAILDARNEAGGWESCDSVDGRVWEFDAEMIGGAPYLVAILKATVVGAGKD